MQSIEEAANRGAVRPPLVYLAAVALGSLLELAWPLPFAAAALTLPLGSILLAAAAALFLWSVGILRAAGTAVPGNRPTTVIVHAGPYHFSRNPIYVAFSLLQLGITLWANSLWLVATLVLAHAVMALVVIPREERYLERKFGAEYLAYKKSVRRWI
jgi:protein-S-isoprenylcysteine O-methyltransferase Ste14